MVRVYERKGDAAYSDRVTIPITPGFKRELERLAEAAGLSKTEYARRALIKAVGAE